jgi:hypothetical protein
MKATICQNECCCNCKHQVKINCHPLNGRQKQLGFLEDKIKIGQGSINQQLAWGCAAFDENPELSGDNERVIIYSDRQHGMCEMHENKTNFKNKKQ